MARLSREEEIRQRYEQELNELHREQSNCVHDWDEVIYDPEIIQEPIYETHWQGVGCWPCVVGHRQRMEDRWSRTCKKCGKVEYTKERVAVAYKPKFG